MVNYERFVLNNGLKVLVHHDPSTPMATVCMTYDVGTKDEAFDKTGYAHLMEHLMFLGSKNATNFDEIIQKAGGENNAFTNQDMTVYYDTVPLNNLESALFLEADRMRHLKLSKRAFEKEKKVVVEEFKETSIDEPYGDIWHHIGPLVYQVHPYQIPTIGLKIEHISESNQEDLECFYRQFYCPQNAILSLSGNFRAGDIIEKVKFWFENIDAGEKNKRNLPIEPIQNQQRRLTVEADVPAAAIYIIFHSAERKHQDYYFDEVISDIMGEGESALIYKKLVKEKEIFSEADVYITGTIDTGLFILEGKVQENKSLEEAEIALWEMMDQFKSVLQDKKELDRIKNKIEHNLEFAEITSFHKAINLGFYELLGDVEWINQEAEKYNQISVEQLQNRAKDLFRREKASIIYYEPKKLKQ